jgi:hypothetical protein
MITVRMALIVITAAVRYPRPGGVSQRLKRVMILYSVITWMTPKAVVPHTQPPGGGCGDREPLVATPRSRAKQQRPSTRWSEPAPSGEGRIRLSGRGLSGIADRHGSGQGNRHTVRTSFSGRVRPGRFSVACHARDATESSPSAGLGDAPEVATQEQQGHDDHPQPEHSVGQQPAIAGPTDPAEGESYSACDREPSRSQRGRHPVEAITQPQQTAKLPRATRALANATCPSSKADLRVEVVGAERDSNLVPGQC